MSFEGSDFTILVIYSLFLVFFLRMSVEALSSGRPRSQRVVEQHSRKDETLGFCSKFGRTRVIAFSTACHVCPVLAFLDSPGNVEVSEIEEQISVLLDLLKLQI